MAESFSMTSSFDVPTNRSTIFAMGPIPPAVALRRVNFELHGSVEAEWKVSGSVGGGGEARLSDLRAGEPLLHSGDILQSGVWGWRTHTGNKASRTIGIRIEKGAAGRETWLVVAASVVSEEGTFSITTTITGEVAEPVGGLEVAAAPGGAVPRPPRSVPDTVEPGRRPAFQ